MMDPNIKSLWVAALRSGKYTQGVGRLRDDGKHCCLGVLCEVSELRTGFGVEDNIVQVNNSVLGSTVRFWSGLTDQHGDEVTIDGSVNFLVNHNDAGKTFLQIADAIEAQL